MRTVLDAPRSPELHINLLISAVSASPRWGFFRILTASRDASGERDSTMRGADGAVVALAKKTE